MSRDTSGLKDDTKETKGMVMEIVNKMDTRELEQFLLDLRRWLSPPDPTTNYMLGLRAYHKGTAAWFIENTIFQDWYSTGSLMWIHGKPGSGKSILCSAIIQHVVSLCDGGMASMAYFYFDFRDDNKKHLHDLLPSLLFQFATYSIPCCDIISPIYSAHGNGTRPPSDGALMKCLMDMLSATTQHPIYIIMDALDECPNISGVRPPREHVLSLVKDLVNLRLPNLHICVTSRPEIDIRNRLEPLTSLRVSLHDQIGHKEDIAKYINSEVDFIANDKRWREDDKDLVIETLSEKADGMFRWVYCQLEVLRLCLRSRVRHFVNELPDSLDETYERVLKGIHKMNRSHVQRLLQCLVVAIRPLRVEELAEVLTSDPYAIEGKNPTHSRSEDQEQEVLSACPSLITVIDSKGSRVIQFSHFSVKEFLTSDRLAASSEDISHYHILPEAAHMTLSQASLGVLLRLEDRVDGWDARRIPLVEYAAKYWVSHSRVGNVSSHIMARMKTLFDPDKPHFAAWVRVYDIDEPIPPHLGRYVFGPPWWGTAEPLYYSALCGFYGLVEYLVKKHPRHINAIGGKNDYPLVAALSQGHLQVAELLFQHGANISAQGHDIRTPLHIAIGWTNDLAVGAAQFLLKHDADVNARNINHMTPLHLAAAREKFEVAQMLLQRGADVNSRNLGGETPLHLVAQSTSQWSEGHRSSLVQLLLDHGAEVNSRDNKDETALHNASLTWNFDVAQVLLNHGAYVNAENNQGQTPFHRLGLSKNNHYFGDIFHLADLVNVARLLLELGADVNTQDRAHKTPLHLASYDLCLDSALVLLDHGANVNAKDSRGQTPLHQVSQSQGLSHESHNHVLVARLLVEPWCGRPCGEQPGTDPIYQVFQYEHNTEGRVCVARLLVEHGVDVNTRDKDNETPLHLASRKVNLRIGVGSSRA
ncbi:ankyrin repeat-containing domain protein [Lactarius deliciosus]|nr:ankyrin repeat-containing domain protein [Lactarius deliciosus]